MKRPLILKTSLVTAFTVLALATWTTARTWMAAQSKAGILFGIARDARTAGFPLPGVQVTLTSIDTKAVHKMTTDRSGKYRFEVPSGLYELKADLEGYSPLKIPSLRVKDGKTTQIGFGMNKTWGRWIPLDSSFK